MPTSTISTPAPRTARARWRPVHFALITSLPVAVTLIAAALDAEGQLLMLMAVPVLAALIGIVAGLLAARRLNSMLTGLIIGLLGGLRSAWDVIGYHVYGSFAVAVAIITLFVFLGFMVGTFVEFVQLLHFVAHGGKVREYRR